MAPSVAPVLVPRTFEVFHFLRAHEIHQRATPVLPLQEYKPGTLEPTKTFATFTYNDPTPSIPYNNPALLGQPTLEGILRSHLEKYGCFVELGMELQSFEDDGERVLAKLVKKKDDEELSEVLFEASYLIGVDGAKGAIRKQLGLTFLGETMQDFACVIGDFCLGIPAVDRDVHMIYCHFLGNRSSNFLMLRPMDEIAPDGFQFLMTMKDYDPKQLIADEKLMFKCMSELMGHEINVTKVRRFYMTRDRPNIRMTDKFGSGRVFIAGVCRLHSPYTIQGLSGVLSLADSVVSTAQSSLETLPSPQGLSPLALLDSYTTERFPVIAEMLNITTGILHKLRETQTVEREKRMNMLGVNCRMSPIVLDEFTQAEPVNAYGVLDEGVLVAGDRAPDATGLVMLASGAETETRLFDVFNPSYHTALVFTPDATSSADVLEALRKYPGDVIRPVIVLPQGSEVTTVAQVDVIVDHGGHAYRGYLAVKGAKKVVVVRPDGVVGAIVHGVEGVGAYFAKIFI